MTVTVMCCPACAQRYAGVVDPNCPVCRGLGTLVLDQPDGTNEHPKTVARAVTLYLETVLGDIHLANTAPHVWHALRIAADTLVDCRLIRRLPEAHEPSRPAPWQPTNPDLDLNAALLVHELTEPDTTSSVDLEAATARHPAGARPAASILDELGARRSQKDSRP